MKRAAVNLALLFFALLVVFFSIWGPEALARYKDKGVLNQIRLQQEEPTAIASVKMRSSLFFPSV